MLKKSLLIYLFFIAFFAKISFSQDRATFGDYEDSLAVYAAQMRNGESDRIKYEANEKFGSLLEEALYIKNSFNYPFDSIKTIARLVSPDKKFRMFNWVISKTDGTFDYYCYMQSFNDKKKTYDFFKLTDKSSEMIAAEFQTCDINNWFGALYYKIIHTRNEDQNYYTLLGWNGNNGLSFKKIIEVLTFRAGNRPILGLAIFRKGKEKYKRMIFEYSAKAIMTLKYDDQQYQERIRLRKPTKNKYFQVNTIKTHMIVFDRLVALSPNMEGQKQYYVPETNIFDAFVFEKGRWNFREDVDARNPLKPANNTNPKRETEQKLYDPKN